MDKISNLHKQYNLFRSGETIGVACSGGIDSMCLLHYLNTHKAKWGINVIAVNVDHDLRANSASDSKFVENYCKAHGIRCISTKVDVNKLVEDKKLTVEQAARELRYKFFKKLLDSGQVNKIALGHHLNDQAETILLNIFRGAGLSGACGMEVIRDGVYIRPMLSTSRVEIQAYAMANDVPFVEDETNADVDYSRNYIRNMIMPLLRSKWPNVDGNICAFGEICKEDDEFIYNALPKDSVVYEDASTAKIYASYFVGSNSVVYRLILDTLKNIGVTRDIEKKHLAIIKNFALQAKNGSRLALPGKLSVIKEYNFITFTNQRPKILKKSWAMRRGTITVPGLGVIQVDLLRKFKVGDHKCMLDHAKLPKGAQFRFRQEGDVFEKFGGGTKSLNEYLIDKKVPARVRDNLPVLAYGHEVYCIPGIEISNKVKIDKSTISVYTIDFVSF